MEQKYGIIYLWFDIKKKRYYLGAHWGTEKDGYICSSRWMKNTYKRRPETFKRRILEKNIDSKEKMFLREEAWLSKIKDSELGKKYYNLQKHWKHWNSDQKKVFLCAKNYPKRLKNYIKILFTEKSILKGVKNYRQELKKR